MNQKGEEPSSFAFDRFLIKRGGPMKIIEDVNYLLVLALLL